MDGRIEPVFLSEANVRGKLEFQKRFLRRQRSGIGREREKEKTTIANQGAIPLACTTMHRVLEAG